MERWTRTIEGRTEHWALVREGVTLTERSVAEGAQEVVRTARCDTAAMAEGIAARMIARHERAGFTRAAEALTPSVEKAPRPSCPGVTDKQLDAVIRSVEKALGGDAYKFTTAIDKAVGDWKLRVPTAWFLVEHKLVAAERMPGLWELLAEDVSQVRPDAFLSLLARIPKGADFAKLYKYGAPTWFTRGFDRPLDALLFETFQRAPARCDARESELSPHARLALDFVRGRSNVALPPARARAVLLQIAEAHCTRGLATGWELARIDHGAVTRPRLVDSDAVRAVALRFGDLDAWRAAMVDASLRAPTLSPRTQRDGLVACAATALGAKLAASSSFGTNEELAFLLALFEARADAPEALFEAAQAIEGTERHALEIRDMLAVLAAGRFGDAGRPVPDALDALLDQSFFSGVYHASVTPYVKAMAALPRERALRIAEKRLAQPYGYGGALAALLAHPDEALLERLFDLDAPNGFLEPLVVGRLGAAALRHLGRLWALTPRDRRRTRHRQVLEALATMGDRDETADPSWDDFITFDREGDETLKYWDPSYASLRARALAALTSERRVAVLRACAQKPYPERALAAAEGLSRKERAAVTAS